IGYIYFYDETNKQFILNTWSKDVMQECKVMDPQTIYDLDKTGCWGEAVRQRKPIIINDYQAYNHFKKGTPEGHVNLDKFLTIPVFSDNRIVAVAGVANKENDYDSSDVRQLSLLMDSVWKISERISLIKDLTIAKEKAEESDRLKSAFLANMSHEIRTPMNGILGFAELLKEPGLSGEEHQDYIRIIEKSGAYMLSIINDIVDISKIEAGLMKTVIKESNVNEQIEYTYNFFKPEVEAKGIELICKNSLPAKEAIIKTDREKVQAILTNLVKNAIKYTNDGTIEFGYCKKDDYLEFYVKDTGIGIAKGRQEAIFERFIQAEIEDIRTRQGSGLGLAISKSYIEMLGGKIWLKSEEGNGSTFYFTLPYNSN
ncbi:MAG: ATP-binding protein, partial [Bacteroidales bacterium]|nr:ATP-binding protein [Bacteroidales bacterium]